MIDVVDTIATVIGYWTIASGLIGGVWLLATWILSHERARAMEPRRAIDTTAPGR